MINSTKKTKKKILIICTLDGFANSVRPQKIKEFLEKRGHSVELLDTYRDDESRSGLPMALKAAQIALPKKLRRFMSYQRLAWKAKKLEKLIKEKAPDILICESEEDQYVLTKDLPCLKIYDCPSPWVEELYNGGKISKSDYLKLSELEMEVYQKTDYLTFHWESYTKYVKKKTYSGNNFFTLNWGCTPQKKQKRAKFSSQPKIVFLGYLGGYWVNLPLLSKLSKMHQIDVYGGPRPPKEFGLNFLGYADPRVLSGYQFGLITLSKDELKRHSFSAKHLEYISYGLPVLVPDWRQDPLLEAISIRYNEKNFLEQVKKYSSREKWQRMNEKGCRQAKKWRWEKTLKPLAEIIEGNFYQERESKR